MKDNKKLKQLGEALILAESLQQALEDHHNKISKRLLRVAMTIKTIKQMQVEAKRKRGTSDHTESPQLQERMTN